MNIISDKILHFVSKYRESDLAKVDINEILDDINEVIIGVPFPKVSLRKGDRLERIRNNYNGEVFYSVDDISFRRDIENICEFGRANLPNQSIFYGSISSEKIEHARVTNVLETNQILKKREKNSMANQIFTAGQWEIVDKMNLLVLPFNEHACSKIELNRKTREIYINEFKKLFPDSYNDINKLLGFFADEFSKSEIKTHHDYKITAAITNVFLFDYGYDGIIYPSVRAEYSTQNIAIKPESISKIDLKKTAMFELFINNDQVFIDNISYSLNLGEDKKKFEWTYVERTPKEQIDLMINKK